MALTISPGRWGETTLNKTQRRRRAEKRGVQKGAFGESVSSLLPEVRRAKSTPDPDTLEKYCDAPPISIAIIFQKYALFFGRK